MRLTRLLLRLGRSPRTRRGPERLVADLIAIDRMIAPGGSRVRLRLESELGRPLVRELERALGLEGQLRPRRRRLHRAA